MKNKECIIVKPEESLHKFYSIEFSLKDLLYSYRFRIRAISRDCIEVLIREDSELMEYIHEGDIVDIKFYSQRISYEPTIMKCELKRIIKESSGRFKGHCRLYICILGSSNSADLN